MAGTGCLNGTLVREITYSDEVAGQAIKVFLRQADYDFSGHKISGGARFEGDQRPADYKPVTIDGVEVRGTGGKNPFVGANEGKMVHDTLRDVALTWNGKKVDISKALHINLMGLELAPEWGGDKAMQLLPSPTGDALLLQLIGIEAVDPYLVSLILRKDGEHQQIYHGSWKGDLPAKEKAWALVEAEQGGADQPATP